MIEDVCNSCSILKVGKEMLVLGVRGPTKGRNPPPLDGPHGGLLPGKGRSCGMGERTGGDWHSTDPLQHWGRRLLGHTGVEEVVHSFRSTNQGAELGVRHFS